MSEETRDRPPRRWRRRRVLGVVGSAALGAAVAGQLGQAVRAGVADAPTTARIRRIAGSTDSSVPGFTGDGGSALAAGLGSPRAVAALPGGDVIVAENVSGAKPHDSASLVRLVEAGSGQIKTLAGSGKSGYFFNPAVLRWVRTVPTPAHLRSGYLGEVSGLATIGTRLLLATNDPAGFGLIYALDLQSQAIAVLAGREAGSAADRGAATEALLYGPLGLAADAAGGVLVAEFGNHQVRRIAAGTVTRFAGTGATFRSQVARTDRVKGIVYEASVTDIGDGGPADHAVLFGPWGIATAPSGAVYVSEYFGHRVRRIETNGTISTVAGTGRAGSSGDGRAATKAQLAQPRGLALDPAGNLFIADSGNDRIRVVDADGKISTIAGTGVPGYAGDGGLARTAQMATPSALAWKPGGGLLVADEGNRLVREIIF